MKKAEYRQKLLDIFKKYEDHPGYQFVIGYHVNRMLRNNGLLQPNYFKVLEDALRVTVTEEEFELFTTEDYKKL